MIIFMRKTGDLAPILYFQELIFLEFKLFEVVVERLVMIYVTICLITY